MFAIIIVFAIYRMWTGLHWWDMVRRYNRDSGQLSGHKGSDGASLT